MIIIIANVAVTVAVTVAALALARIFVVAAGAN